MSEILTGFLKRIRLPRGFAARTARPEQLVSSVRRPIVDKLISLLITGYEVATESNPEDIERQIEGVPPSLKGVVYEGIYARLAMLDIAEGNGGQRMFSLSSSSPAAAAHMGAGVGGALSNLRVQQIPESIATDFFGWLTIQALAAHDGYFRWPITIERMEVPQGLPPWALRAYDEGLGAAIWYVSAANPKLIAGFIERFPHERRRHLWDGVGMQIGFWGMDDEKDMKATLRYSGRYDPWLQQGVLNGAAGVLFNGAWPDHTEAACNHILRSRGDEVIGLTQSALAEIGAQFTRADQFIDFKRKMMSTMNGVSLPGVNN